MRTLHRPIAVVFSLILVLAASTVAAPATVARQPTGTSIAGIDIDATTIPELQDLMDRRRLNAVMLTQFYLQRIRRVDPLLNAVITVNPNALAEARAADRARRQGDDRPLLGMPIILKDNINTTGMPTTAGSWSLAGSSPADAFIVEQLRAAGAIILGKANLSEWANFRSAPSSSGWSGIGGQGSMAYVLDRNPCGSSSGSAVATSASLAVAGVGTETDGSVVCPAGANSVVGIKPTIGLLSREGIIPISADQDTAGPIARNVTDAAVLLGAMTGIDPADPATTGQVAFTDYTGFLKADALDGARIGFWSEPLFFEGEEIDPAVTAIMESTVDTLTSVGATVIEVTIPQDFAATEFDALLCEFKTDLPAYFETYTGAGYPKTLQDVIDFNEDNPELEGPWNSLLFELAEATGGRSDSDCVADRAAATPVAQAVLDGLLADLDLDAIIAPTNGPAWVTDPVGGDFAALDEFTKFIGSSSPAAVSGYANITVPAGYVDGVLPIGVSFIGGQWDEPNLLALAYAFEQAPEVPVRVPPQFLSTLP